MAVAKKKIPAEDTSGRQFGPSTRAHEFEGELYPSDQAFLKGDWSDGFSSIWLEYYGQGAIADLVKRALKSIEAAGRGVGKNDLLAILPHKLIESAGLTFLHDPLDNFDSHALMKWRSRKMNAESAARMLSILAIKGKHQALRLKQ